MFYNIDEHVSVSNMYNILYIITTDRTNRETTHHMATWAKLSKVLDSTSVGTAIIAPLASMRRSGDTVCKHT